MRLIDADKIDFYKHNDFGWVEEKTQDLIDYIKEQPTVDAELVVHAHWKYKHRHYGGFRKEIGLDEFGKECTIRVDERWEEDSPYCSNCGKFHYEKANPFYCPHCGAKMDEEA